MSRSEPRVNRLALAALCCALAASALAFGPAPSAGVRELTPHDYRGAPGDLVLWGQLAKVGVVRDSGTIRVIFLPPVRALDGKTVSLLGFMSAVSEGEEHQRFLLTSQPLNCTHCRPPGPADIVEVNLRAAKERLRQTPVFVRGTFKLVQDPRDGPIFKLQRAVIVERAPSK